MTSDQTKAAGKSSYDIIDQERFWQLISLEPGMAVLDLGCGIGNYSLPLAGKVGSAGKVIAVDSWAEGIGLLKEDAAARNIHNIETHVADARKIPLTDHRVDLCLLATVLHDFAADGKANQVLQEVVRVLKPKGLCAVVEFKKQPGPPGPPEQVRLSAEDVTALLQPLGFVQFSNPADLGQHFYFAQFGREHR